MNRRMIVHILSRIAMAEAFLMLPCLIVGFIYRETAALSFLPPMAVLAVLGLLFGWKKPQNTVIYARDGMVVVAASWLLLSVFGAVPFYLSGEFNSIFDCFFEIVSGFTTTGATAHASPESLSKCILFWRSFSHWVGGMGVLVFVMAIMPLSDERSLHLMRAEVPGPVVGKLVPRMRKTAIILYAVYTAMTAVLILLLIIGKMSVFDALCHAFGTAGTGGFSVLNAGIGAYNSAYIEIVLAVAMLLFGVNFNLYYLILIRRAREALRSEELRCYVGIVAAATLAIFANTLQFYDSVGTTLRHAFFQVASIITTTGYSTTDFALWPMFSQGVIMLLMLIGACAGSTAGGLKIGRVMLLCKSFWQEIRKMIHPRAIKTVRLDGKPVERTLIHNALVYIAIYLMIFSLSTLLLCLETQYDFLSIFSAEMTCINNIGPGLSAVGPMGNFGDFSAFSKILLSFNMLLGRLEIFPILILFSPHIWRKNAA